MSPTCRRKISKSDNILLAQKKDEISCITFNRKFKNREKSTKLLTFFTPIVYFCFDTLIEYSLINAPYLSMLATML